MGNRYLHRDVSSITPLTDVGNVVDFPIKSTATSSPFGNLTVEIILAQHRAGTLPEAVLLYLLAGVGLWP
jgi:hypothetical protein